IFFRFFSDLEAKLEELKIGPTGEARTEGGKKLGIEMIKKIEKEGEHRVDISLKKNLIDPGWGSF
ncbi:MAG: hypothetical protein LBD32_02545, partial [Cytophagales bacterium]|nr:hypothetical protein [Cytophagales bacterium]